MGEKFTALEVATWMADEVLRSGELLQSEAVAQIETRFGEEFIYTNDGGGQAISKTVLAEFRRLTDGKIVWSKLSKVWRLRDPDDTDPGRMRW